MKIRMLKKNKSEIVQRYKVDDELEQFLTDLRDDLYICTLQHATEIRNIYNSGEITFSEQLSDRERDMWECIFTIARFVDKRGNSKYEDEMRLLANQDSRERTKDNVEKNPSYKLLNELCEAISSVRPIITEGDKQYYCADTVFNLLTEQEGLDGIRSKRGLTMELKNKFQIETRRKTVGTEKIITYVIVETHLRDLLERYNISDVSDQEDLSA